MALAIGTIAAVGTVFYSGAIALIAGVVASGATLLGIVLTYWSSVVRAVHSDEEVKKANLHVAEARNSTHQLRQELDNERAQRVALEERQKARTLSKLQTDAIRSALADAPKGPLLVKSNFMDMEGAAYAKEIMKCLQSAGYDPKDTRLEDAIAISAGGLWIALRDVLHTPPHAIAIGDAFKKAGIQIRLSQETYVPDDQTAVLWVGHKL